MAFTLQQVVPWGRNMEEYDRMFALTEEEKKGKIASFGDGPASFQKEMYEQGNYVRSYDPIYQFDVDRLCGRIQEAKAEVRKQMLANRENFIWKEIASWEHLEALRMAAMTAFLEDFPEGKGQGRYVDHQLPDPVPCEDGFYDLGLSSHFLLMYTTLGLEFHLAAIREMLRVCREVRIFPVLSLNAEESELAEQVIDYFSKDYDVQLVKVDYEFQKGANQMLRIKKKRAIKCNNLTEVRREIDRIDGEIIELLGERTEYVKQAAAFKKNVQQVKAPGRVEQVIESVRERASEAGADPDMLERLYRGMIADFIEMERRHL